MTYVWHRCQSLFYERDSTILLGLCHQVARRHRDPLKQLRSNLISNWCNRSNSGSGSKINSSSCNSSIRLEFLSDNGQRAVLTTRSVQLSILISNPSDVGLNWKVNWFLIIATIAECINLVMSRTIFFCIKIVFDYTNWCLITVITHLFC